MDSRPNRWEDGCLLIFVCGATKNIIVELYRTKDEFPILFEEVLIYIESKGFQVKRINFDSAAEEIGRVVGQKALDGETPRFAETGRRPDPERMGIYPFGRPVYVEDFAPAGKEGARCNLFFNLGLSRES
jgi:hypothetical protein